MTAELKNPNGKRVYPTHSYISLVLAFLIKKKGARAGNLESVGRISGEKIMATALQDTDGSASHPYQFFSKKLCRAVHLILLLQ